MLPRFMSSALRSCAKQCHLARKLTTLSRKHGQDSKFMVSLPNRAILSMANRIDEH